jgi:hypothetical protein
MLQIRQDEYTEGMVKLQAFRVAARDDDFIAVDVAGDGSAEWLRSRLPDAGTNFHKRLCLDGLTNSATIYWQPAGAQVNSKTFRTVSGFQEWLESHPRG